MANTYLDVPSKSKDEAKALGAHWDAGARKWYVPEGKELAPFGAWLPAGSKTPVIVSAGSSDLIPEQDASSQELALPKKGVTLSQLLARVAQAVALAFKFGVWTIGEGSRRGPKTGMSIWNCRSARRTLASWRASIWANTAKKILPEFEKATGASIAPCRDTARYCSS